jgi:hypothetical protein
MVAATLRKRAPLANAQITSYQACGNGVALTDIDIAKLPDGNRQRVSTFPEDYGAR